MSIGHSVNKGLYLVKIPDSFYEDKADIIINDATKEAQRKQYIEKGDYLEVVAVGEDCTFAKVGDLVIISARGMESITLDGQDEPFLLVRESEVRIRKEG
jgi:hypothetical protein